MENSTSTAASQQNDDASPRASTTESPLAGVSRGGAPQPDGSDVRDAHPITIISRLRRTGTGRSTVESAAVTMRSGSANARGASAAQHNLLNSAVLASLDQHILFYLQVLLFT